MDLAMVRLSGPFAVVGAGGSGGAVVVEGRKARRLLARLAAAGGRLVGVDELVEDLWPAERPRRPAENVATLVSRLRAALGPDAVTGGRGGYRVGPGVAVDVTVAAELADRARAEAATGRGDAAAGLARRALALLDDAEILVGEPPATWIDDLRSETADVRRGLRHVLSGSALAVGDVTGAVAAARAAASADPLDDRAHRDLMAGYRAAGEPGRALAAYERLRAALARELGADPSAPTRALHVELLRDGRAARPAGPVRSPAGRDGELRELAAIWSGVRAGRSRLCLVTGEAGIGKTTVCESLAAAAAADGAQVITGRCHPTERALFVQPVLDALGPTLRGLAPEELRELAGAAAAPLAALLPDLADVLGGVRPAAGGPELERARLFDAIGRLLGALTARRPVLLVLDDLHNAGTATVELLHRLATRLGTARLLVLTSVRTEEGADALDALADVARRVDLGPLPPDAVALLAARAGASGAAEDLIRRTRGHPLFVVEVLRALDAGDGGVPESLQAAVQSRTRRAGPEVEELVRVGAVWGRAVAPETLAGLLELAVPEVLRRCARAVDARLLVEAGAGYEFANDLVQEVLYATTPTPVRDAYHRRAADLCGQLFPDRPEALARHAAAVQDWARAARALLAAGEQALARYAAADALALLDEAVAHQARADVAGAHAAGRAHAGTAPAARLLHARARARIAVCGFDDAVTDLRTAVAVARRAGDRFAEMAALRELAGDVTSALGLSERAEHLAAAVRLADALEDRPAQADLYGWQAVVATNRLQFVDAISWGHRAVAAGRASGSEPALMAGLDGLKTAYAYLGDVDRLAGVVDELEPLLRRRGALRLLYWTVFESAFGAVAAADWDAATARLEEALEINGQVGEAAHTPWLVAHAGWIARLAGHPDRAAELGERAVGLARTAGHRWWRVGVTAMHATTLLELGRVAEARAVLAAAQPDAADVDAEAYRLRHAAAQAEATGAPADAARADALLARVVAPPGAAWLTGADAYVSLARAWLGGGDAARAAAVLGPLLAAADVHGWAPVRALAGPVAEAARGGVSRT